IDSIRKVGYIYYIKKTNRKQKMSVTNTFEIRVVRHQIQSCLRAIKNGLKSFVDRLIILEDKLEKMLQRNYGKIRKHFV
ncbi:MAG: hypothetical protein ACKPEQ_11735, partial [Dolichospermum sp.]